MSLRVRVLVGMAVIAAVLGLAAVVITCSTERELVGRVDGQLTATVALRGDRPPPPAPGTFADDTEDAGDRGDRGDGRGERLSPFYEGVVGSGGEIETRIAPNLDEDEPLPEIDADRALAAADTGDAFTVGSAGSDTRYRVMAGTDPATGETFVIALALDDVDATLRRLIAVEAGVTVAVLAVVGLVSWWVIHLGVRPLKRMLGCDRHIDRQLGDHRGLAVEERFVTDDEPVDCVEPEPVIERPDPERLQLHLE